MEVATSPCSTSSASSPQGAWSIAFENTYFGRRAITSATGSTAGSAPGQYPANMR
ncbi:hypothetical protein ACFPPE_14710 [Agromyces tardus]|uniref:hypothetical protein n=1 Tax=Agromyces tardus TaxID=2583849 RepID=UPI001485B297